MIQFVHRDDCCGCCSCAAACPHGAIKMEADGMGFRYPVIDKDLCTDCGFCEKVCAFKPVINSVQPKAEAIRFPEYLDKSQSGGLGYALMCKAIGEGYVVYGAAMDADFVVRHRRVETQDGLDPLRLSKYVQSDMDGIPGQVLADLKAGREVLFTGTPCQCAGIGSLCAKYREHLLLADIVCHGVPAPAVWRDYLAIQEDRVGKKVVSAVFRDPAIGWNNLKERIKFEDGEECISDTYLWLFLNNLILRPSCANCPFSSVHRVADISMADCWGIERALPGFADDNHGCSLLLVNTKAGEAAVKSFGAEVERSIVHLDDVMQSTMRQPVTLHNSADKFRKVFLEDGLSFALHKYGRDSSLERMKRFLPRLNPLNTKLYKRIIKSLCG